MFLTEVLNLPYARGPDQSWKRRRVMKLAARFHGRKWNCYRLSVVAVFRMMKDCTKGRRNKKEDINELREVRIQAGCEEHKVDFSTFREGLQRNLIFLNRKVLADLAIWEPRTFKALTDVAKAKAVEDGDFGCLGLRRDDISHFVHRGLMQKK